jgi:ABC-2 type transport system ATP-binding protein
MSDFIIETEGLTKYFGAKPALDHLTFRIPKGSVYGLLGRNGSGKTTAIKLILGFLNPTAGIAKVFGCPSNQLTPEIRLRIGYTSEGHHLDKELPIRELEKFQSEFFAETWDSAFFNEMIEYFELPKKKKIKTLSNGQRAQVSLALTLAFNPELLIMDDPTLGLDTAIRRQFLNSIVHLIKKKERTILFSSHILSDVERVADRVAVLDKGVLRADCTIEEFRNGIQKYLFEFEGEISSIETLAGLVYHKQDGNVLEATFAKIPQTDISRWAEQNKAKFRQVPMGIEDQFIEFTEPKRTKKMFSWEAKL